jgi:biopolymer transport protein ExbB
VLPQGYNTAYELISKGGVIMWPIFVCSILALAIAIERFYSLRRTATAAREFMDQIRAALRQNRIQEAVQTCDETNVPIARIVKAGLLKHNRSKEDIREAIEDAGHLEMPRLERHLAGLATCASVAPLLGLLGTVQGMIKCFATIENKQGLVNPSDLAEGIGNALITTFAGLIVAIPTLVAYNYFVSRVENVIIEMEIGSSEVVDILTKNRIEDEI